MSTISREDLLDAARHWQGGERPLIEGRRGSGSVATQVLNPFPRFKQEVDLFLNVCTFGVWSLPQLIRLIQSLRKDDPECLSPPWKIIALSLLSCGVWGVVAYVQIFMAIEGMRSRHRLHYDSSWLGYIVGFFLVPVPPAALFIFQYRLNQSADEWGVHRGKEINHPGPYEALAKKRKKRFVFVTMTLAGLAILGVLTGTDGLSASQDLHQGKRVGGILRVDYSAMLSWSPSDHTIRVWDSEMDLLWTHAMPTQGIPARLEQLESGRLVMSSHSGEIMVSSQLVEEDMTLDWRDLPVEPITGFEILSGDRILTRDGSGAVTMLNGDGQVLTHYLGLASPVKGTIELDSGIVVAWSRKGMIRSWRSDGQPRWALPASAWAGRAQDDSIRGVLELDGLDILCWSKLGKIFILSGIGDHITPLENPYSGEVLEAFHLDNGELAMLTGSGQAHGFDGDGSLLYSSPLMDGKIVGAQSIRAPSGETNTIAVWNSKGELRIWKAQERRISDSLNPIDEDPRTPQDYRFSGVFDGGDGTLWAWTAGGEILHWEF